MITANDYLECGIIDDYVDTTTEKVTVYVHTKDQRMLVFHDVLVDPVIYKGWFSIEHEFTAGIRVSSQVPLSDFSHLSYMVKERRVDG